MVDYLMIYKFKLTQISAFIIIATMVLLHVLALKCLSQSGLFSPLTLLGARMCLLISMYFQILNVPDISLETLYIYFKNIF